MRILKFLLILITFSSCGYAQRSFNYFSFGLSAGISHYQGDLDGNGMDFFNAFSPSEGHKAGNPLPLLRPAFGIVVNYHFHPYMYARLNLTQAWIGADDKHDYFQPRKDRNLSFESSLTEVGIQLVYEFFAIDLDFRTHHSYRLKATPYIFAGISLFVFNPTAKPKPEWIEQYPNLFTDPNESVALRPLGTEGQYLSNTNSLNAKPYSLIQPSLPIGMGVRYRITTLIDLRLEFGLRVTFTDYLDDVSGNVIGTSYANPDELKAFDMRSYLFADKSTAQDGYINNQKKRGDPHQDDLYGFTMLTISYILDDPDRCPKLPRKMRYRRPRTFVR